MAIQILPKHVQETLVALYLRLNGYFTSGHIIHAGPEDLAIRELGEIDVFALRLPYSQETETGVPPSEYLRVEIGMLDIIIGEVKSGVEKIEFNPSIRNPKNMFRALHRAGFTDDDELLSNIAQNLTEQMEPRFINRPENRIEIILQQSNNVQYPTRIRPIIFHLGYQRPDKNQAWFVGYGEIMGDIWERLRIELQPDNCQRDYDYHLWGPVLDSIVDYFKSDNRIEPGTPAELIRELLSEAGRVTNTSGVPVRI